MYHKRAATAPTTKEDPVLHPVAAWVSAAPASVGSVKEEEKHVAAIVIVQRTLLALMGWVYVSQDQEVPAN
jgi:hypothetical protein